MSDCFGVFFKKKTFFFKKKTNFSFFKKNLSWLTGGVCVSVPLLASRLRMLLSDICRRAAMGGTLASVAGNRVTSAFMSLSSSSSWFSTAMTTTNLFTKTYFTSDQKFTLKLLLFDHVTLYKDILLSETEQCLILCWCIFKYLKWK